MEKVGGDEEELSTCEALSGAYSLADREGHELVDLSQMAFCVQEALRIELFGLGKDLQFTIIQKANRIKSGPFRRRERRISEGRHKCPLGVCAR